MFEGIKNIFKGKEKNEVNTQTDNQQKESLSVQDQLNDLMQRVGGPYGVSFKLAQDIFSDKKLTVHQEKAKCKKAYNENGHLQKAVNNLVNTIEGQNPHVESENQVIKDYAKEWNRFSNFGRAGREARQEAIITGDGYVHILRGKNGSIKYKHIENSEDMYIDWNHKENRPNRYIRRLYYTEAQAKKLGISAFTLDTPYGKETIYGIEYSPDEIIRFKFMYHSFGIYGRSPIASVLSDIDIIKRIERSIAVISMFKAIPQKILFPKQQGESTNTWNDPQIKNIQQQLKNQQDFESSIIGTPVESLNVTDSGQIIELTGYLDYFKRKVSISLSPEFIIHGENVNRSTSSDQKGLFYLDVSSIRGYFEDTTNNALQEGLNASLENLRQKGVNLPNARFWWEWGTFDVEVREEKNQRLLNEWKNGLIPHNEYRQQMGYKPDELMADQYYFDLMKTQGQQAVENLKDAMNDGENKENQETEQTSQ